jgi:hypothetical protein
LYFVQSQDQLEGRVCAGMWCHSASMSRSFSGMSHVFVGWHLKVEVKTGHLLSLGHYDSHQSPCFLLPSDRGQWMRLALSEKLARKAKFIEVWPRKRGILSCHYFSRCSNSTFTTKVKITSSKEWNQRNGQHRTSWWAEAEIVVSQGLRVRSCVFLNETRWFQRGSIHLFLLLGRSISHIGIFVVIQSRLIFIWPI